MANHVNFYLKKAEESTGKSLIYLQFKYQSRKLVYSFGQTIDPNNWSKNKQRVKSLKETTNDGMHSLNDLLDSLQEVCIRSYRQKIKHGIPNPAQIKENLNEFINQNKEVQDGPTLYKLIDRFISGEIKSKGRDKSKGTLDNYRSVLTHLKSFEKVEKYKIDFDSINLDFFYKYVSFLKNLPLSANTISKDVSLIKLFMGEAVDLGYTSNVKYKHKKFTVSEVDTDAVYLTDKEIHYLYNYDLSENKRLEQVRDLFVFGCCVGLRFSDYSTIKQENITKSEEGELYIKMITAKTRELVIIPCSPIVLKIFEKYKSNINKLPKSISNQKFNTYIKQVCEKVQMTEKGRLSTKPDLELWMCISSHTARRSFATNLYLEGFPTIDLMKITGHKTEKAFLKYIRVSKLDTAKRLNTHIKTMWSKKLLKVAGDD